MAHHFFTQEQKHAIVGAIKNAEMNTSGEVQVHIESNCKKGVMDRAAEVFAMLHMHNTKLRNGVLFYLAVEDHKFAILGDAGINSVVPTDFWEHIKEDMQNEFRKGHFTEGLCKGIEKAGKHLKEHFPRKAGDVNELSDEISFGKH